MSSQMMANVLGERSDKATKKYRTVKEEIFDNLSTVACLGDEPPSMQSDDEVDVGFLTDIKTEVDTVRKKDTDKEFSAKKVQPAKLARLTETVASVPSPVREYSCRKCPRKFNTKLQLMLHKQFHTFEVVPRNSVAPGTGCEVLNTGKSAISPDPGISHKDSARQRAKNNLHGQENEFNRSDVQNNNGAEAVRSSMEDESFNIQPTAADSVEDSTDNHHSVWDADFESESSICDRSSDENYSDDEYCSDSSIASENRIIGNSEAAFNKNSHNASAQRQKKKCKAREVEKNGPAVSRKKRNEHKAAVVGDRKFTCSYCEKRFKTSGGLKQHLKVHTGEKPYKCDLCGKGFIERNKCIAHRMTHTGERPYKCTDCEKAFVRKSDFKEHRKIHAGDKQHCCQFCGKSFFKPCLLKYHTALHKGPKPYSCLVCKRNISSSDKWKRHVEKYHKNEYEDVAAGKKEKKEPHKKPHKCGTCDKCFIYAKDLERHQRIHSGERPYICKFCDRTFTLSYNLKTHLFTHSGTKPYLCIVCKVPFSSKYDMVSHRQSAHENTQNSGETASVEVDTVDREPPSSGMADSGVSDTNDDVCLSERAEAITGVVSSSGSTEADERDKSKKKKKKRNHFPLEIENEQEPRVTRFSESPEAISGLQSFSVSKESDVRQKSLEKKKKRRMEIENELDTSDWQTPRKKGRQRDEMLEYTVTGTQDESQYFFHEVNDLSSAPQEDAHPSSLDESVVDQLAIASQKIRFKRRSIEYIIEKNAKRHPDTLYVVWSEVFSLDLAAAVAFNEFNCILCVKKFDPSSLPDVWSISRNFHVQSATVNIDSVAEPIHFFIFGYMNLSLGRRPFKTFKKIESRMKKFARAGGMDVKNILRYSRNENSWYSTLLPQLKEDCIVANKHDQL